MRKPNPIPGNKPFPKGVSGNPKGRPKKLPQIDVLLADVLGEENSDGIEAAKIILMALRKKAAQGDVRAAELLLDRAYGKSKQQMDVTSGGNPVPIPQIIMPKDE
jgi:hypothetical protein